MINGTIFQAFEWNLPNDGLHWKRLKELIPWIKSQGFTAVWLPPVCKPVYVFDSCDAVGYGCYDLWDLGEFDQCGAIRTKYGTKEELDELIHLLHEHHIQVYVDAILNHKSGRKENEINVYSQQFHYIYRNRALSDVTEMPLQVFFNYPVRNGRYSDFVWNAQHFTASDLIREVDGYDQTVICKIKDKEFSPECPDDFLGNFDYLVASDLDLHHHEVQEELIRWGIWMVNEIGVDGFRLDALKHMSYSFISHWIKCLRSYAEKELFFFGEYGGDKLRPLENQLNQLDYQLAMNDFPLQKRFHLFSRYPHLINFHELMNHSFTDVHPVFSVGFCNSHDSQPRNADSLYVEKWFQPFAYAFLLTREQGYPIVFWGDWFGTGANTGCDLHKHNYGVSTSAGQPHILSQLMKVRSDYAYGIQHQFVNKEWIAWSREGNDRETGCVAIFGRLENTAHVYVGNKHLNQWYYDLYSGHRVYISSDGYGDFPIKKDQLGLYVPSLDFFDCKANITNNPQYITLSYKDHTFPITHIHFRPFGQSLWKSEVGERIDDYTIRFSVCVDQSSGMECCFYNENQQWDNAYGKNYQCLIGDHWLLNQFGHSGVDYYFVSQVIL